MKVRVSGVEVVVVTRFGVWVVGVEAGFVVGGFWVGGGRSGVDEILVGGFWVGGTGYEGCGRGEDS